MASQPAVLVAFHVHCMPDEVRPTDPIPPVDGKAWLAAESEYVHAVPDCATVTRFPPTATVPVRELVDEFAAAVTVTVPLPLPAFPPVTVSQAALLTALQEQPDTLVTPIEADPPPAPIDSDVVDNV